MDDTDKGEETHGNTTKRHRRFIKACINPRGRLKKDEPNCHEKKRASKDPVVWWLGHFERIHGKRYESGAICIIRAVASSRVQLASVTRPLGVKPSQAIACIREGVFYASA